MNEPFGVSQYTTWPQTFAEDLALYQELGIGHIEVCEAKLRAANPLPQIRALQESGLQVASVQARYHSPFPNSLRKRPTAPRERMALLTDSVRLFGRHFPGTTLVVNTGLAPKGNLAAAYDIAVREFRRLAKVAGDCGVRLGLEPLHPIYMNTDTFITSLAQAGRIIDEVDHPAFGLFLDLWHVWEDESAVRRIGELGPRLFGVHLSDWGLPRAFADRLLPGTGEIPMLPLLEAVRATGYNGIYTLEIFSDPSLPNSLWADPRGTVERGRQAFVDIWRKLCG